MKICTICKGKKKTHNKCRKIYRSIWSKNDRIKNYKIYQERGKISFNKWYVKNKDKNTERQKKYRKTLSGKIATRKAVRKYENKNPIRRRAWNLAKKIKREPCIICHKYPTHRHHPDITKPRKVIMLCPKHHKEVHKARLLRFKGV